jgi:tRNA pseudouridine38-40 synthase
MRNLKLIIEYDGTAYHGWQRQPNGITIQQVLEEIIATITQRKSTLISSGRTDAGVHALNQVAHCRTSSRIPLYNLLRAMNSMLPHDIVVKEISEVDDNFHARYSAISKVYLYRIHNNPVRTALWRNIAWHIYEDLDVVAMKAGLKLITGTHDFSSFCGANDDARTHVRTVIDTEIRTEAHHMISVKIEANGFLRYMVRNIVGTLADVGKGKIAPMEFYDILQCQDRTKAGVTAPPQGLFLKEVRY